MAGRAARSSWVGRHPLAADALLAVAVALVSVPSAFDTTDGDRPVGVALPLTLLAGLPLAARRARPVAVLGVTLVPAIVLDLLYNSFQVVGPLIAMYTVAVRSERQLSVRAAVTTIPALAVTLLDETASSLAPSLGVFPLFAAGWLLGENVRTRRAYLAGLEEKADRLEREREAAAHRAVAEEQARIARELHDVVAHSVSVMTIQAAAAGDVFESHPGRAREALGSIETTGRQALSELRRLLGAVRGRDEGGDSRAPRPGLARLEELVDTVRRAGLAVELRTNCVPSELPVLVDLSAYRIVQESLTNTLKHAGASAVTVVVRQASDALTVEVTDDGAGPGPAPADAHGRGLIGMSERAQLLGGELLAHARPGGGFAVTARLPLTEGSA